MVRDSARAVAKKTALYPMSMTSRIRTTFRLLGIFPLLLSDPWLGWVNFNFILFHGMVLVTVFRPEYTNFNSYVNFNGKSRYPGLGQQGQRK